VPVDIATIVLASAFSLAERLIAEWVKERKNRIRGRELQNTVQSSAEAAAPGIGVPDQVLATALYRALHQLAEVVPGLEYRASEDFTSREIRVATGGPRSRELILQELHERVGQAQEALYAPMRDTAPGVRHAIREAGTTPSPSQPSIAQRDNPGPPAGRLTLPEPVFTSLDSTTGQARKEQIRTAGTDLDGRQPGQSPSEVLQSLRRRIAEANAEGDRGRPSD
jgi:hypothetical protein